MSSNKLNIHSEKSNMGKLPLVKNSKIWDSSKSLCNTNIDFIENFSRREKRRKIETKQEIERMRAELPTYNLNDIRFFKLPFHEALILQLKESDYINTEGYITQLFELNERLRVEAGPQNIIWNLPLLKHSDKLLKLLSDALIQAENEQRKANFRTDVDILLKVAVNMAYNYTEWFWLTEELLLQCIDRAQKHKISGKHEAISHFIYAKLLIEKVKDFEKAENELTIARELSTGKSWNVKNFLPDQRGSFTLFMLANSLLHLCYIKQARHYLKTNCSKALEFAILAKKRAAEACYPDGETAALFIKGQCELNLSNTKDAVSTFNKAYYIQSKLKSEKGMCEALVELSKAYLMHGSTRLALNTLLALKTMAEEHGFQFYLAQAYRYLGEYYLNCGEPHKATPLLTDALKIFHDIGDMFEADKVRNLGALSSGLELMPLYISLLQKTDKRYASWYDNLIKLVKWKDSRERFWTAKCDKLFGSSLSRVVNSIENQTEATTQRSEYTDLSSIFEPKISTGSNPNGFESLVHLPAEDLEMETDNITYS